MTETYLKDSAYEKIFALDSLVYNADGQEIVDINGFAMFALNCVTANYVNRHIDIYPMLRVIEKQLMKQADSVQEKVLIQLSDYYGNLGLYRRAFETLELKPRPTDSLLRQRINLADFLKISESYANSKLTNDKGAYVNDKGAIIGRLCDLLIAQPLNGWYEEFDVKRAAYSSLEPMSTATKPENALRSATNNPIFSFLTRNSWVAPDTNNLFWEPGSFSRVAIEPRSKSQFIQLVQEARNNDSSSNRVNSAAIRALIDASYALDEDGLVAADVAVFNSLLYENTLVLSLYDESAYVVFIIKITPGNDVQLYGKRAYDIETMQLVSATGTSQIHLLITSRSGSGGFLDVELIDIDQVNTIFSSLELYHGGFTMLDLDADNALEIITTYATGERIVDCNQCPSPYISEIFDFDARAGKYLMVTKDTSGSELLAHTFSNMFGMGPLMIRSISKSLQGPNVYVLAEKVKQKGRGPATKDEIEALNRAYRSEFDILQETNDFVHAAALGKNMLNLFKQQYISTDTYPIFYLEVFEDLLRSLMSAGEFTQFHQVEEDQYYHRMIDTNSHSSAYNLNLKGIVYLHQGQYGNAYDCLLKSYLLKSDINPAGAGNLALYYSLVSDTISYYKYSLEAVNKAVESEINVAINLLHVAKSGVGKLDETEQLDYLIRAIKYARGSTKGEQVMSILQAAAQIAVNYNLPELGLKLLHQAIEFTTSIDWDQEGAYIMLLYSRCLEKMNKYKEATYTYKTTAKLAKGISKEAYITSCHELSKIYYNDKYPAEAFYYSQLAFDSVNSFRKTINELNHKFSFLVDKKEVVEWHFKLLLQKSQQPAGIFNALELWKMRSFVDAYKDKGIYKNIASEGQNHQIADQLQGLLNPSDLLIDFSINKKFSFAITMTRKDMHVSTLNVGSEEIRKLVNAVRQSMDVNNSESLEFIRDDKVNTTLRTSLASLYAALFGPVEIPPEIKRIIILPDESLYGIPWSALVIKEDGRFFLEKYEYSIFPSAAIAYSVLTHLPKPSASKSAVILACLNEITNADVQEAMPVLKTSFPNISFGKLSSGENEAKKVGESLKEQGHKINYLLDRYTMQTFKTSDPVKIATRGNLINEIRSANILHCITHGIFNLNDPMHSCLFVEFDNGNRTIKPKDLIDSDLSNLSMVSLSACQTGINNLMPGSEPIGFLRSFLGAGTSQILLTEWEVDDKTISSLFENFYKKIGEKEASTALNEAKLAIKRKYNHPYYWAGVTLYGSPH